MTKPIVKSQRRPIPNFGISWNILTKFRSVSRVRRLRFAGFAAFAVILVLLIIASFVAYRADSALPLNPDLEAITPPIDWATNDPLDADSDIDSVAAAKKISADAEQVLIANPLNALALRILGQVAAATGDEQRATAFFQAAARLSLRESPAVYWLAQKSYEHEDFAAAVRYVDALLRTRPQLVRQVSPLLASMLENESARAQLETLLADDPPWRTAFLATLPAYTADARITLNLLLTLRNTSTPPNIDELSHYLNFMVKNKLYEVAYYAWLQFLRAEQLSKIGFLVNGSFETSPSGLPFDWVIKRGSDVIVDFVRKPEARRQHALFIEFGHGRAEFSVEQLIMLAPGTYQFEGQYRGEVKGRRGLVWRLTCADDGKRIGQSEMVAGEAATWTDFSFSFTVPDLACRAQFLQLLVDARSASERLLSGSIWYDDLKISRLHVMP